MISENIVEQSSIKATRYQFDVYGEYVNLHRHIPHIMDGLKPSYRRLILSALNSDAATNFTKTATIVGNCMAKWHPHGDMSLNPIVSELVHSKIFIGKGNHGKQFLIGEDATAAASRYTEAKLSPNYLELLKPLMKYVPHFINDLNHDEVEYLPTPIPIGLTFGYLGIGSGTGVHIPSFTSKSILNAYLNNDPELLEQSDGLIIINKSELHRLWTTGRSHIRYKIKTYRLGDRIIVEGEKGPLNLDWSWIEEQRKAGRVDYDDETTTKSKVSFFKMPRVQFPTLDEIEIRIDEIVRGRESYYTRVVYNDQVRDIGLYDWIDITYKNYINLYKRFINDEISKIEFDVKVFENFRAIADKIINEKTSYEDIAKQLKVELEVVKSVGSRTINTLRNTDPSKKIPELKNKIKGLKKFNIDDMIKKTVDMM